MKKAYHRSESDGGVSFWFWKRQTFYESDIYRESEGDDDVLVLGEEASV